MHGVWPSPWLVHYFCDNLSAVFEHLTTYSCPVVIYGDFDIQVDQTGDPSAVRLQLLESFGYVPHVTGQTHAAGHTLDLVITRSETVVSGVRTGDMISDHALIRFTLSVKKPRVDELQWTKSRAWRRLSRDDFASGLAASRLLSNLDALSDLSVDDLVKLYHDVLTGLLDRHCPIVTVRRRIKQKTPWFDADCRVKI